VLILALLASYIITQFMVMSVDVRVYEFGIMRTIGLNRIGFILFFYGKFSNFLGIIFLIIMEGIIYVIPVYGIGIGVSVVGSFFFLFIYVFMLNHYFQGNYYVINFLESELVDLEVKVTHTLSPWSLLVSGGVVCYFYIYFCYSRSGY
jgi:hypothetical protein